MILTLFLSAALAQATLHTIGPDQQAPPLALALDMALGPGIWAEVKISSAGPVAELSGLVQEGFYKLEIIQLVLMSAEARKPLRELVKMRKKPTELARIAQALRIDYDKLYARALVIEELVDREYLPRFPEPRPRVGGQEH